MNILVINAGSSSLKYQLFDTETKKAVAKGLCERIGIDGAVRHTAAGKDTYTAEINMLNHADAIQVVVNMLTDPKIGVVKSMSEIDAVGHRVVHGAEIFASSVLITDAVMAALNECIPLAPLHKPPNITGIWA